MAYPFLPVNPCCTDVVLNDPCGCSSTLPNTGCGQSQCGTNVILSSNVLYNGPVLDCIIAEPCDTLNVILQKIDEIICNLLTQINLLNIQIHNITQQIINIEGDIININNTLAVCCGATTTTTTTAAPIICESFSLTNTGSAPVAIIVTDCVTQVESAIVLLPGDTNICVVTDSPLTVPGTVIVTPEGPCGTTTTSTTLAPTTTTTSTTAHPCECLTFYNADVDPHIISYTSCTGEPSAPIEILSHETLQFCGCCGYSSDSFVEITIGANCVAGLCPSIPTTTTTSSTSTSTSTTTSTTTTTPPCNCFQVFANDGDHVFVTDCNGVTTEELFAGTPSDIPPLIGPNSKLYCAQLVTVVEAYFIRDFGPCELGSYCNPTTTTTTTICSNPNVLTNSTFTTNLDGWTDSIPPDWTWSSLHGGSAHYTGRDEHAILSQNALTPGVTYDITFNLWCANPTNIVKVLAGTTEYSVTGVSGYVQVNLTLTCVGTSLFGFQGYDELGPPFDTIYINDVVVSEHCPQFTTTTTSSSSTSTSTSTSSTTTSTSSTTTTTTKSPTTTTTTTAFAGLCTCVNVNVVQADIDASTGNVLHTNGIVYVIGSEKGVLCRGGDLSLTFTSPGQASFCIQTSQISTIQLYYFANDNPVYFPATASTYTVLYSACTTDGDCEITSTTTSTTTACVNCTSDDVTIGTQVWTGCNLNVDTYANGDPIPQVTDPTAWAALTTGAWCYNNNDPGNELAYGKLYNLAAVLDPRGLAPTGYHVPSATEWATLATFLGGLGAAGGEMKEVGTCHWDSPNNFATNSSGWTGLGGNHRAFDGTFYPTNDFGFWWTTTSFDLTNSIYRGLTSSNSILLLSNINNKAGLSVRLIQD